MSRRQRGKGCGDQACLPGMPHDERAIPLTRCEVASVAAFWAVFAVFRVADRVFTEPDLAAATRRLLPAAAESLVWLACTPLVVGLVEWSAATRRRVALQAALYAGAGLLAALAALAVSAVGAWLRTSDLVGTIPRGPARRFSPPYWFWVGDAFAVYLGVLSAAVARAYVLRIRSHRAEAALLEARLAEARLEALRRQLDPHFLFNTLSLVASLIERDPPGARRMIARLGDLLRASFSDGDESEIPLHQELALVDVYLDIMRMRFAGRLEIETRVGPQLRNALVPPLVLQSLVENAVKHGVERARGSARITIDVARDGDAFVLRIRDTGSTPERGVAAGDGSPGSGIGLRNTRARLEQLYGRDARLTLDAVGGGTEAEVRLPLHTAPWRRAPAHGPAAPPPTEARASA